MGLSLAPLKRIGSDILGAVESPFESHPATPAPSAPTRPGYLPIPGSPQAIAAAPAPAPVVVPPPSLAVQQPPASIAHDLTHNPLTNFLGASVGKPVAKLATGVANSPAVHGVRAGVEELMGNQPAAAQQLKQGEHSLLTALQTAAQNPAFLVSETPVGGDLGATVAPESMSAQELAMARKVHPGFSDEELTQARINAGNAAQKISESTPPKAVVEQAAQTPQLTPTQAVATPTLEGNIPAPRIAPSNTGIPEIDKVIDDVASQYSSPAKLSGNVQDVVAQAGGQSTIGQRASNALGKVLKNNLTPEEDQAVDDFLDGNPTKELTPKAFKVANALKPVYGQAHNVRSTIDPNIGEVEDYSTRIPSRSLTAGNQGGGDTVLGKIKSLADVHNLNSAFSKERLKDKFVGSNGSVELGSTKSLGLSKQGAKYVDDNGKVYSRLHATKQELTDAGLGNYERLAHTNNRIYHSDTLSLKARGEAVQTLAKDPAQYGLYTEAQIAAGEGPKDAVPVTKVNGLTDANGGVLYGSRDDVKALEDNFGYKNAETNKALQAYDAATNVATKTIVLNPLFHGMNQLYQTAIAAGNLPGLGNGWIRVANGVLTANEDDIRAMLEEGGHSPTYGADMENILSKATGGATKVPSKLMASMELRLRAGLYKASVDSGMKPKLAIKNIDTFLGDSKAVNATVRRTVLFAHYFKTMSNAMYQQLRHPVENAGATLNTLTLAALTAAISYGYQKATGNPNANVRSPGELGLVKQVVQSVKDVRGGQLPSIVTNRINPVGKEIVQQAVDKDLYTGQPVTATGRLAHAESTLIAPDEVAGKVTAGKRSGLETAANQLGLNTPHAKGYQAAPKIPALNTPAAIREKTGDPTGYQQQQQYFTALHKAQDAVSTDKKTAAQFNDYITRSKDPITGQTIQLSPAQSIQTASSLFDNDKLRNAVQTFEKSQPQHDPMWDLSPDKLKAYEQYKAMYTGDAAKNFLLSQAQNGNDNWITDVENSENTFYNNLQHAPGGKPPEPNAKTPTYPVFDPATQSLLNTYNGASSADRATLLQNNAGELSSSFDQIAQWTNAMRKAEGAPQLNDYPVASPQVQSIINTYDALPKGNGPEGGSPDRAAWINANPDAYAQMQSYLTSASVQSLIKNAALAQFQGSSPNQELLKDIKNVGQYDVATSTDTSGNTDYSLNPELAYAQSITNAAGSSGSSSSSTSSKEATQARDSEKSAKALKYAVSSKNKLSAKVSVKKPTLHKYKVGTVKVGHGLKVAVKPSKLKV